MSTEFVTDASLSVIVRPGVLWWTGATVVEREPRLDPLLADAEARVRVKPPAESAAVRTMYKRVGIDPTKTRPSNEALLRRIRKGGAIPRINSMVDIINWCSVELQLPYGLYDLSHVNGPVILRLGRDGEEYAGIRKDTVHLAGRITVVDDEGPFGNPTSDSARAMVTSATRDALVVIYAPSETDPERLKEALDVTGRRMADICGGSETARLIGERGRPERPALWRRRSREVMLRHDMLRLMFVSAIIAAGGRGARLGADRPKQFLDLAGATILDRSIDAFLEHAVIDEVIVALPAEHVAELAARYAGRAAGRLTCVAGGSRRQDSVAAAFAATDPDADIVVIHDAARPFVSAALIDRTVDAAREHGAAVASLPARDTVKQAAGRRDDPRRPVAATLPREDIYLAQTPQAFRRHILARALDEGGDIEATDEAMLAERSGATVHLVQGDPANVKITTPDDLQSARHLWATGQSEGGARVVRSEGASADERSGGASAPAYRIGTGYDLHRLVDGRRLVLGGVTIPFDKGLDGHSDADIVCHAVTDAVLGAAGAGDIGRLFPDTDPQWKDADSVQLLKGAVARVRESGYVVGNVDVTVIAQQPKLLPFLDAIRARLADALKVDPTAVSVKGKTNERMDSMGRGESMACHAVALVVKS